MERQRFLLLLLVEEQEEEKEEQEEEEEVEEEEQHCDTKARLQQNQSMRCVLGSYLPQRPQSLYIALNTLYHKIEIYSLSIATALNRLATLFHKMLLSLSLLLSTLLGTCKK